MGNCVIRKGVSIFDDIVEYDEITTEETMYELVGDPVVFERYINAMDTLFSRFIDIGVRCWANKGKKGVDLHKIPIKFKMNFDDEVVYTMPFNRLMCNLPFLIPVIKYIDNSILSELLVSDKITSAKHKELQFKIVGILKGNCVEYDNITEIMADVAYNIKRILEKFSHAEMYIYTAENIFLDHYRDSKIIKELNDTYYDSTYQISDIVKENDEKCKLLKEEMIKRGNRFFLNDFVTKVTKPKQLEESFINFSAIPDGRKTVPFIQNGNGFKQGYNDVMTAYVAAISARVPDLMNKEKMGDAGYFNRNLMILTYGTLSDTVHDCHSVNTIKVLIDEVELEMKEGRYYTLDPKHEIYKPLSKNDTHLIGKTAYFRSPCTCNLGEDVCHICYGNKATQIGELKGGFIYTTETMTSRISQNILSAKHLLKVDAEPIILSPSFEKYFTFEYSEVSPIEDKKFDIYIPTSYHDEDLAYGFTFYVTKDLIPIKINNYQNFYIPDIIFDKSKKIDIGDDTYYKISSLKVADEGGILCNVIPINKMVTQQYTKIMKLFESELPKFESVDEAVSVLTHNLHKLIPILSVHGEIMISRLIRRKDNILLKPNYREKNPEYQLLRLQTGLQNSEAITTAYSFEKPKYHTYSAIVDQRKKINRVGPRAFSDYLYMEEVL